MWWRNPSILPLRKIILTHLKNRESTSIQNKKDKYISNKSDKGKLQDESRSTQITETEDIVKSVNKLESISSANLSDKSTKIVKPKEIDIRKDNSSLSVMSVHGESVSSVTPDKQRIPRKNKRKKTSDTLIKGKESIQEPDNSRKGKIG